MEEQVSGDKIREIEMYDRIKTILVDFLRGYPAHKYWGIFETYFKPEIVSEIINQLKEDEIIKLWKLKDRNGAEVLAYSLTGKGAQLATSLRTHLGIVTLTKKIIRLTKILGVLTSMAVIVGFIAVLPEILSSFVKLF